MNSKIVKAFLIIALSNTALYAEITASKLRKIKTEIIEENIPNCMNISTHYDKVYCSGKIYNILDDKLNGTYKSLSKKLSKSQKNELKVVQRKWIRKRDDKCARSDSKGVVVNLTCSIKKTSESLYYLREMKKNLKDFSLLIKEYKANK